MDLGGVGVASVGLLTVAIVMYVVTKAAAEGRIDVNSAVGMRTKTATLSQQAWEIVHRAAFPWVRAANMQVETGRHLTAASP